MWKTIICALALLPCNIFFQFILLSYTTFSQRFQNTYICFQKLLLIAENWKIPRMDSLKLHMRPSLDQLHIISVPLVLSCVQDSHNVTIQGPASAREIGVTCNSLAVVSNSGSSNNYYQISKSGMINIYDDFNHDAAHLLEGQGVTRQFLMFQDIKLALLVWSKKVH